jgi:hypothetical protein
MMEKKTVKCNAEFSAELVLSVPYAYWLHENNLLEKTIGTIDTKPLYFFSENHEELTIQRTVNNDIGLKGLPNTWIHHNAAVSNGKPGILDFSQWLMPPFKDHYRNDIFVYDKPLLIISNKYAIEWGSSPVNFIDIQTLYELIDCLQDKYTLVYKRPNKTDYIPDENELINVGDIQATLDTNEILTDYDLCRRMGVIVFNDLFHEYPDMSYNEFQFKLFANCDNYISVQGGNSHICALFGKTNINYIVRGKELRPGYFDKDTWYYRMNGCDTIAVSSYPDLLNKVKEIYA